MTKPKLIIKKKFSFNERSAVFYHPDYPNHTNKAFTVNLEPNGDINARTGEIFPYLNVKTEKELLSFIYNRFGEGTYYIVARVKKRQGFYPFWKGEINSDGWICNTKESKTHDREIAKTLDQIQKIDYQLENTSDQDEKEFLMQDRLDYEDILNADKDSRRDDMKDKRYGIYPFLKSSGRRGVFHSWDEEEIEDVTVQNNEFNTPDTQQQNKQPRKKYEDMSLDDINNF